MLKENVSKGRCTQMIMGLCCATIWNFLSLLGNLVGTEKGWMRLLSKHCLGFPPPNIPVSILKCS